MHGGVEVVDGGGIGTSVQAGSFAEEAMATPLWQRAGAMQSIHNRPEASKRKRRGVGVGLQSCVRRKLACTR